MKVEEDKVTITLPYAVTEDNTLKYLIVVFFYDIQ